ncbi:MAG: dihydrodipicolinate synthase family protein [Acidobacteria bacterium]|nr:dihydrodipicolinate synthase family protein [Acidobacteriota bacterium]MBI3663187.1 dihydrodipicolinate synthase family protein [Acidobacteriota bacterium]
MKLHGIFPPVTTPFNQDGSLALDRLRENISRYNGTGVAGYVVIGSTGESVLLSRAEIEQVWAAAREAAADDKILIAGTGVDSTAETIDRTNRAAELGYHVALVKTPYYYKPQMTAEVHAEHYLRVADAARIPLLIYSVPQFTGVAVEAPLVARLGQHPNIIGIKESSGVVQRVGEILHLAPAGFQTLVGSATTFYPSMALGAVGGILAVADIFPELCVELYDACVAGDPARARARQERLLEPTMTLVAKLGIPGVKYAMDRVGYYGGPARRPLLPLNEAQRAESERVLEAVIGAGKSAD